MSASKPYAHAQYGKLVLVVVLVRRSKGHVTRSNFSCNLQRNKRCVASCKKKFTCNNPFCNCNCWVASCKKSRTTLYFSQRCKTSYLRVTSPLQLESFFLFVIVALQVARKIASCNMALKVPNFSIFKTNCAIILRHSRAHAARIFADVARGKWPSNFQIFLCFWPTTQYVYVR